MEEEIIVIIAPKMVGVTNGPRKFKVEADEHIINKLAMELVELGVSVVTE